MASRPAFKALRAAEKGKEIFFYHEQRTRQVVYSFTRALKNKNALAQLPFICKKSKPAALRRDKWIPFAAVSLPTPALGLKTYHKLREFRKLHEWNWEEPEQFKNSAKSKKYHWDMKTPRMKVIQNQKANSVADLAASLEIEIARVEENGGEVKKGDVVVCWQDILDAEYAETWDERIVHTEQAPKDRYAAPKIVLPEIAAPVHEGVVA